MLLLLADEGLDLADARELSWSSAFIAEDAVRWSGSACAR